MKRPWWQLAVGWIGLLLHLGTLVFYAASGLVAPGWAVVLLLVVWAVLLGVAIWLLRTRPVWVPAVPVAAWFIWWAAISAGEAWLNWTA
jgi:hypothetical protein